MLKEETALWVIIGGVMISDELINAGIFVDVTTSCKVKRKKNANHPRQV